MGSKNNKDCKSLFVKVKYRLWKFLKKTEIIFLERRYPAFGNLVPRDVASRAAKERCDAGIWC